MIGWPRTRVMAPYCKPARFQIDDEIDYEIIGYDIDYDIISMIS
jgi:hypothetical protein